MSTLNSILQAWARDALAEHPTAFAGWLIRDTDSDAPRESSAEEGDPDATDGPFVVVTAAGGETNYGVKYDGRFAQDFALTIEAVADYTRTAQPVWDAAAAAIAKQIMGGAAPSSSALDALAYLDVVKLASSDRQDGQADGDQRRMVFVFDLIALERVATSGQPATPGLNVDPLAGPAGGVRLTNIDTQNRFELVLRGDDANPQLEVQTLPPAILSTPATAGTRGPNGGIYVFNIDTGTRFEVVLGGTDANPQYTVLAATQP